MVIALAQNSQFHLKLALKPFWPYTLLLSASVPAMSRFTPGKSGAGTSSLPASCCHPPPSLLHGKQSLVGFLGAWVSEVGVELRGCAPAWALTWERAGLPAHPSFVCVATCAHALCSCALESSLLWHFVLENKIWECYRGSWCLPATTLRGDFMDCPNLQRHGATLATPKCAAEKQIARIFKDKHLLFPQI